MKKLPITSCPICGSKIQSTEMIYRSNVTLSGDGKTCVTSGEEVLESDVRIYCSEDHTQEDMIDFLDKFLP